MISKYVNDLFHKHYQDAIAMAHSRSASLIDADDKEALALQACWRAARNYDVKKKVKFTTLLLRYIINEFKGAENKLRMVPAESLRQLMSPDKTPVHKKDKFYLSPTTPVNSIMSNEAGDFDIFEVLQSVPDYSNLECNELLYLVRKKLSIKQRRILNVFSNTKWYADRHKSYGFKFSPTKITYQMIARILNCSKQRVDQQMVIIRRTFEQVLKQQESSFCKLTEKDKGVLYG